MNYCPAMSEVTKVLLDESEMPRRWYNILADLPSARTEMSEL